VFSREERALNNILKFPGLDALGEFPGKILCQRIVSAEALAAHPLADPKERTICAAPYPDRVVHHALCSVTAPVLERSMVDHTYACRAGKGTGAARQHCRERARRWRYALKLDVRRYFPTREHGAEQIRGHVHFFVEFGDEELEGFPGAIVGATRGWVSEFLPSFAHHPQARPCLFTHGDVARMAIAMDGLRTSFSPGSHRRESSPNTSPGFQNWMPRLVGFREANAWRYLALLNETLRALGTGR